EQRIVGRVRRYAPVLRGKGIALPCPQPAQGQGANGRAAVNAPRPGSIGGRKWRREFLLGQGSWRMHPEALARRRGRIEGQTYLFGMHFSLGDVVNRQL